MTAPSLGQAALFWGRLGLVSFGGPAGQIALLHEELVVRRRWLSEGRYLHALNYCMLLPGPEATQLATYLGWLLHGVPGGLVAGGLFLLPSAAVLLGLSCLYALHGQLPLVESVFQTLKPVVLAIVLQAAWRVGRRTLHTPFLAALALAAFLALGWLRLPYPLLILAAAASGVLADRLHPGLVRPRPTAPLPGPQPSPDRAMAAALHGDQTPPPPHAQPTPRRLALLLLASGLALGLPLLGLSLQQGWDGPLATMARFFTQVALISFGGAYAVLPYVAQGAVEQHGWLTASQMVDGLALGETTPGPLIMVVAFVGFMGGWNGSGSLLQGLTAGAVVVWFTFLPSFGFILLGAPLVEATRHNLRLAAPLTAITAAVVGVIASLALLFAKPALLMPGTPPALNLLLLLAALALLLRGWGVLPLLGLATLVGVGRNLVLGG